MEAIRELERSYRKPALPQVQSGDTVRVHQLIREGAKQRTQVFEGVVIRTHRMSELTATVTVRRIASGIGVEKTFLLHSPNVAKLEILRRAKVRRNFLSYLRARRGKSARLHEIAFDKVAANNVASAEEIAVLDTEVTEIDAAETSDALDEATSINAVENAENAEVTEQTEAPEVGDDADGDEAKAPAEEVEIGLDHAEPGEGDAVSS